ncbi:MAG: hypothetical protein ABI999_11535 [Acidobacteriota bacterium]
MGSHNIHIPRPSRFISLDDVDSIAQNFSGVYREHLGEVGLPLDVERFLDWLEISYYWDNLEESEGATCFARIDVNQGSTVEINEHYRDLFENRPEVYRICLGHEAGHLVLNHPEFFSTAGAPTIFNNDDVWHFLHKESWNQYGLTSSEVRQRIAATKAAKQKLVKNAVLSRAAYNAIKLMDDKCELDWMFWQAEHFARCITIPKAQLFEILEQEPLSPGWGAIYKLAKVFEVPPSSMTKRLEKLNLIEMDAEDKPIPIVTMQGSLF